MFDGRRQSWSWSWQDEKGGAEPRRPTTILIVINNMNAPPSTLHLAGLTVTLASDGRGDVALEAGALVLSDQVRRWALTCSFVLYPCRYTNGTNQTHN